MCGSHKEENRVWNMPTLLFQRYSLHEGLKRIGRVFLKKDETALKNRM